MNKATTKSLFPLEKGIGFVFHVHFTRVHSLGVLLRPREAGPGGRNWEGRRGERQGQRDRQSKGRRPREDREREAERGEAEREAEREAQGRSPS